MGIVSAVSSFFVLVVRLVFVSVSDLVFKVFFTTMDGAPVKDIHVVKTARPGEDGVYDYTITSPLQGQFLKHVVANGKPLQGGPFVCTFGTKVNSPPGTTSSRTQRGSWFGASKPPSSPCHFRPLDAELSTSRGRLAAKAREASSLVYWFLIWFFLGK